MVSARRIIDYMKRRTYSPLRARTLAKALGVEGERYTEFRQALRELHQRGIVVRRRGGKLGLAEPTGLVTGVTPMSASQYLPVTTWGL